MGLSFFFLFCFFHLGLAALANDPELAGELLVAQLELVTIKAKGGQRPPEAIVVKCRTAEKPK